jgi:hypothetical protein
MTRLASLAIWAAIAGGFIGCEALSLVNRRRTAGFDQFLSAVGTKGWRTVPLFVGWMWLGWHFFAR